MTVTSAMSSTEPNKGLAAFVAITALLSVVALGFGTYELWHVARLRTSSVQLAAENRKTSDRLDKLGRVAAETDKTLAGMRHPTEPRNGPDPAQNGDRTGKASREFSRADWEKLEALNPQIRGMLADIHRAQLAQQYRAFFEQAGLTPDQIEAFLSRKIALFDQSEVMAPNGGFYPTKNQLPDDEMKSILGEPGFEAFQAYSQKMPAIGIVNGAATVTAYAGVPLSTDQQTRLTQILVDNNDGYANNQQKINNKEDFASVVSQAQGMMTPAQWNAAKGSVLSIQYQLELMQARNAANSAAAK